MSGYDGKNVVIAGGRTGLGRPASTRRAKNIDAAPTVLFIHGSLDDAAVWGAVIAALDHKVNTVTYELPGFGPRAATVADPDAVSLESLAAEAGEILNWISTLVIVVGQCMGTQIAEIVAADHAEQVVGLVLLTPVPLGGTHLSDEEMASFRDLANHPGAQRAAKSALTPGLTPAQLDRLVTAGTAMIPEVVARYADIWNDGVKDAPAASDYAGPVLVIRGGLDAFVTEQLASAVVGRFADVREHVIDRGGHWLHIEYPDTVAATILEFNDAVASGMSAEGWRRGFADQSQSAFAERFADDIVLEATTLAKPVEGKQNVATVLAAASSIYESLEFTAESQNASTTYLQWRARAFGGMQIDGITILERRASGKIVAAAIHHRPLGAVLRFSAEIRDRLAGVIPADHFLKESA
jgi:pimeloyl-ACP methyl ester carboxylesterase